jgi:hypothetical protein
MDNNHFDKVKSIFLAAIERCGPERAGYLDGACANDAELRGRVEELLQAHEQMGSFHEQDAGGATTADFAPIAEGPGTTIGRYKLLQKIGEGGFGVVFMAEQREPVVRKVALKIIKPGMDTREVIARFEAERQALALMDHPNIARVLDAGSTDSGRPFFVMELVKGIPIAGYCDEHRLSPRERLELFVSVCNGIQHAQRLRLQAMDEMLRIIREEEPPRPSLRLGSDQSLPAVAACRRTEPAKLQSLVRGELDWIVMKAMEKDRCRRYETAHDFARDVERYLNNEPVHACPPSPLYRLGKFVRRNRAAVMGGVLVVATLFLGMVGVTWLAVWLSHTVNGPSAICRRSF